MSDLECSECEEEFDFEGILPFGDDVKYPHCGVWLATGFEEDLDNLWFWVTGKSENQDQIET